MTKRADFEGDSQKPPQKIAALEKALKAIAKARDIKEVKAPHFEEEHSLWELAFVNSQGAEHVINWELASTPEYRQMMSKYKQIEPYMQPPYYHRKRQERSRLERQGRIERRRTRRSGEGGAEES